MAIIYLPAAINSRREYTIKNLSVGEIEVKSIEETDTINNVSSRLLQRYEALTVVDYASGKYRII